MSEISKIIEKLGISRADFCKKIKIPYRTVENWEKDMRKPPDYIVDLINFYCSKVVYATISCRTVVENLVGEYKYTVFDANKTVLGEYNSFQEAIEVANYK